MPSLLIFDWLLAKPYLLDMKKGIDHWKIQGLDFSRIFHQPDVPEEVGKFNTEPQDHGLEYALDNDIIKKAISAIENKTQCQFEMPITNTNRTVGTMG